MNELVVVSTATGFCSYFFWGVVLSYITKTM